MVSAQIRFPCGSTTIGKFDRNQKRSVSKKRYLALVYQARTPPWLNEGDLVDDRKGRSRGEYAPKDPGSTGWSIKSLMERCMISQISEKLMVPIFIW